MKRKIIWHISVCVTEPVPVVWEAAFLHCPTHEQIKEAIRFSLAEESRLSQTDKTIKEMSQEYEISKRDITDAMNRHIQGLAWLLKQNDVIFDICEDVVWEE